MTASDPQHLTAALIEARARVEAAAHQVPTGCWDDVIQTGDGAWTRRQLLAHLAANDLRQLIRIRIGAGIPLPGDAADHEAELDVHTWNGERVAERSTRDPEELLAEMRANREALLALVAGLTPEQRARPMPFRGRPTPLPEMVSALIGHLDAHAKELLVDLPPGTGG